MNKTTKGERRGLFDAIFGKPKALQANSYFKLLNGYTPVFTNAPESIYEMELTRAAIHQFATFCSKLKPEMTGKAMRHLEKTLQMKPLHGYNQIYLQDSNDPICKQYCIYRSYRG